MAEIGIPIDPNEQLSEAIAAARGGRRDEARALLEALTAASPFHEQAFLWMAALADTPAAAVRNLERVLQINPRNLQAINALAAHRIQANTRRAPAPEIPLASSPPPSSQPPQHQATPSINASRAGSGASSAEYTNGYANPATQSGYNPPPPAFHQTPPQPQPKAPINLGGMRQSAKPSWRCPLCDTDNLGGVNKCRRCGALQDLDDVWALAENRGVDESLVTKGAERWLQRLIGGPNFEAHINVARAFLNLNRSAEALVHLERACEMRATERGLRAVLETLRSRKLVLAVDDSLTVRRLVSVALERKGYRVITAEDGLQALARLSEHTPNLILLDITMPKMDGYELCKIIKRNQHLRPVPVLMLSGKDGIFDKIKGRIAGATDYMSKPFDVAMLLQAMDKHLGDGGQTANN